MSTPITEIVVCHVEVDKIWQALTDVEQMKEWYFTMNDFELAEGKQFYFYEPGENRKYKHVCTILEIKPNEEFRHTWSYPELTKGESTVSWYLKQEGEHTTVTLTHEHLETFADGGKDFDRENFVEGWNDILQNSLKTYVEK